MSWFKERLNSIRWINSVFFLSYIFVFILYGKVSVILFDGSHTLYKIYAYKMPVFYENRFPTVINYVLPTICSKLGGSFNSVFWMSVINYALLPIGVFLYLRNVAKCEQQVSVFLFSQTLFALNIFFVPSHDALTGYYLLFILYSLLDKPPVMSQVRYYTVITVVSALIVFSHLSQSFSILMLAGYFILHRGLDKSIVISVMGVFASILLKILFLTSQTEDNTMLGFHSLLSKVVYAYSDISFVCFFKSMLKYNYALFIIFIFVSTTLIFKGRIWTFLYLLIYSVAILVFVSCFFFHFKGYNFYTEMQYKTIGVLLAIIIIRDVMPVYSSPIQYAIYLSVYFNIITQLLCMGKEYMNYYDEVKSLVAANKENTLYYYPGKLQHPDEQIFLPLESTAINMHEYGRCNYIGMREDTLTRKIGFIPDLSKEVPLCFSDTIVVVTADSKMKQALESKYTWYMFK